MGLTVENEGVVMAKIHPSAQIDYGANLGSDVVVWANTHIREEVKIGDNTVIGEFCYIGPKTVIGKNCKIQNGVYLYEPSEIEDGVFIGPRVVITNDKNPRAINSRGDIKRAADWIPSKTTIQKGASIGAGAVIVSPLIIGEWAMVAAGSVVTHDVANFSLVAGIPARQIGWVSRTGYQLNQISENRFECPISGEEYILGQDLSLEIKIK